MKTPNYLFGESTPELLLIIDVGPWDKHPTVTNGAEDVVAQLAPVLRGRRLEYIDSEGNRSQLLYDGAVFKGFAPV